MQPVEIKKDIHWVGAVDWDIRDFHGYSTPKGTTYNAFLIMDEKIALVDTVKKPFLDDLVRNIQKLTSLKKIDYIIVNHVEMDHSGSLPVLIDMIQPEKVICSSMGKKALIEHFHRPDWPYEVVETGQTISLGKKSVQFIEVRMLHWPDSMVTYVPEDQLLLSSDGFGQHWATCERFDDQVDINELLPHAAKYYANILLLYSPLVQKLLANVQKLGLKIDMIAPDHGLIWRSHPDKILGAYDQWSKQVAKNKAVVIYDTMWHSTETMAQSVADGLMEEGLSVKLFNMKVNHRSDVMTELLDSKAVILGSPTLNNGILPSMADIICYMKGLKPANKVAAAFGSYGWSGEAVKIMTEALHEMKFNVVEPGARIQFAPNADSLKGCYELGRKVGMAAKEIVS
ncbi:MAG: flavodoxin domain-containing protein [Syntrophobacteraceae bacterium]|jgi:flavorubredoxin|nr:flavodoxin domain-containing protein [Syntrophobacteraceae bacterium]